MSNFNNPWEEHWAKQQESLQCWYEQEALKGEREVEAHRKHLEEMAKQIEEERQMLARIKGESRRIERKYTWGIVGYFVALALLLGYLFVTTPARAQYQSAWPTVGGGLNYYDNNRPSGFSLPNAATGGRSYYDHRGRFQGFTAPNAATGGVDFQGIRRGSHVPQWQLDQGVGR